MWLLSAFIQDVTNSVCRFTALPRAVAVDRNTGYACNHTFSWFSSFLQVLHNLVHVTVTKTFFITFLVFLFLLYTLLVYNCMQSSHIWSSCILYVANSSAALDISISHTVPYFSTEQFSRKKSYWLQNACFDTLHSLCLNHFSFYEFSNISWMRVGPQIKYPLFASDLNRTGIFLIHFRKISNHQI
jgi:hypothetical protein